MDQIIFSTPFQMEESNCVLKQMIEALNKYFQIKESLSDIPEWPVLPVYLALSPELSYPSVSF